MDFNTTVAVSGLVLSAGGGLIVWLIKSTAARLISYVDRVNDKINYLQDNIIPNLTKTTTEHGILISNLEKRNGDIIAEIHSIRNDIKELPNKVVCDINTTLKMAGVIK